MSQRRTSLLVILVVGLLPLPAFAQSANTNVAAAPLFIALGIAYVTRRMSIGGWLFYYYLQLYGTALFTLLSSVQLFEKLQPSGWNDLALHTLFALSVVPPLVIKIVEVVLATRLLIKSQRNERNVTVFRYVLAASVIACAASFAIDSVYFSEDLPLSIIPLVFASIWCLYFFFSRRVRYVFSRWPGIWSYESFKANANGAAEQVR